jgi:hypothetical protein
VGRGKIQGAGFGSGIRDAVFLCSRLTAEAAALREVLTLISLTLFSSDCFVSFIDLGIETFAQLRWLVGLLLALAQMEAADSATAKVAPHRVRFASRAFRRLFSVHYDIFGGVSSGS